jgi:glycine cleavage system H protein
MGKMIQVNGYRIDQDCMYTKDHVWVKLSDERNVLMGLSDYFLKRYRSIQSCEFPKVGARIDRSKTMGVLETVKGTAQLYAAVTGDVKEVNDGFLSQMKDVLEDPYGRGWILKVECSNLAAERGALLSAEHYASHTRKLVEAGL